MYTTPKSLFTAICDEVRAKTGTVEPIAHQDIPLRISEISGGEGGNYQAKSVTYTSSGTDTVTPDAGYDALSEVNVTVDVAGSGAEPEPPDDGKTRLYIDIPDGFRKDVPLYWSQTVSDGVLIDKGDGSEPFTVSGTGEREAVLSYSEAGKYCITMDVVDGEMEFGRFESTVIGGDVQGYQNMLYKVETGDGITSIESYAFYSCHALQSINIPDSATRIGSFAFYSCHALQSINIPDGVTSIEDYAFYSCHALQSINIPDGVTSIEDFAFRYCTFMKEYIVLPTIPPTLSATNAFTGIPSDCQIFVPDGSVSAYKAATNWATYADKIYPLSERVTP